MFAAPATALAAAVAMIRGSPGNRSATFCRFGPFDHADFTADHSCGVACFRRPRRTADA